MDNLADVPMLNKIIAACIRLFSGIFIMFKSNHSYTDLILIFTPCPGMCLSSFDSTNVTP